MSALYLKPLDHTMEKTGLFYARFMDDWVVLAPTRWRLRKAIKKANQVLGRLKVEKHPDKTFIGKVDRGFDFLGYHFTPLSAAGLEVAKKTLVNHVNRISRLYEQGADAGRIGIYIRHWYRWLSAGVRLKKAYHSLSTTHSILLPRAYHHKSLYVFTHRPRFLVFRPRFSRFSRF
jgi:hypothetical protein